MLTGKRNDSYKKWNEHSLFYTGIPRNFWKNEHGQRKWKSALGIPKLFRIYARLYAQYIAHQPLSVRVLSCLQIDIHLKIPEMEPSMFSLQQIVLQYTLPGSEQREKS